MGPAEAGILLAFAAVYDNRSVTDAAGAAWAEILADVSLNDARRAVVIHYSTRREWLMPADVIGIARRLRNERREGAEREARAAQIEGGTTDRSAEIKAFIAEFRSSLPEGSREALFPRRAYWEQENRLAQRQREAVPNPLYRPQDDEPGLGDQVSA